jgi:hypothetical protein
MKDHRITVRLSSELQAEIAEVCRITGLDEPTIIRECLKAFVDHVKDTGEIRLPLAIVPKSTRKQPFSSTVVLPVPENASASRLNESAPSEQPTVPRRSTRQVMRDIAKKAEPKD